MARVLIVAKCPTHPTTAGNRRFILNQVELFKRMGHDVYFLYIMENALRATNANNEDCINHMKEYWKDNFYSYNVGLLEKIRFNIIGKYRNLFNHGYKHCDDEYPHRLTKYVDLLNKKLKFDCCIVNYYTLSRLLIKTNISLKGLVTHDYFSYKNLLLNQKKTWMGTSADQEAKALQRSPHIFALNTEEGIYFSKLSPQSRIYNVFSVYEYYNSKIVGNKELLFLSGPNQFNIDGLNWFLSVIFPEIVKVYPNVKLRIGGGICKLLNHLKNSHNIELIGYVDDARLFYETADIVINPTYQGTGLKIKTFEGISYDKIVMAHPHSLIGIYQPEIAPIFASTNANEWINALDLFWSYDYGIDEIKRVEEKNRLYIEKMNTYIESEYSNFFAK